MGAVKIKPDLSLKTFPFELPPYKRILEGMKIPVSRMTLLWLGWIATVFLVSALCPFGNSACV
jgi:hypothetical protein